MTNSPMFCSGITSFLCLLGSYIIDSLNGRAQFVVDFLERK